MNVESRLAKLESQNRTFKVLCLAALVAAAVPWAMGSDDAIKEDVRGKRFTLVSGDGSPCGTWSFDEDTKTVSFRIDAGNSLPSVVLTSSPEQSAVRLQSGIKPGKPRSGQSKVQRADVADIAIIAGKDARAIKVNDGEAIIYQNGMPAFVAPPKTSVFPVTARAIAPH